MTEVRTDILSKELEVNEYDVERLILRSMNEGVVTLECNGNIHTVNPAALRILGLSREDLKGKSFQEAFSRHPENEAFRDIFEEALKEDTRIDRKETRFKRDDGQIVDLSVTSSFLEVDECAPSLQSVVVVFRDITAFKSLERVKRRAVNHLSHELKTPLAIVQASVEQLIRKELPREQAVKALMRAHRNTERLSEIQSIVEEILNPPTFRPARIQVKPTIEEMLEDLRGRASGRSVSLTTRIDVAETDLIDPLILSTVLETLVKNAIENTPDDGEVIVSVKETEDGVLLKVEDSGVGITIQDQEFIFEGFLYTQATDEYSSKKPFQFNAGGKGLELLRLKVLAESGYFDISFETRRCTFIPTNLDHCPGRIADCRAVQGPEECRESGGTTFFVLFRKR